ncbi:MAG: Trk family potassium uptake protein [Nitrospinae bacterium]|nr:Trk family potassium uptake protein [Nitrospinota bacterium]
MLAYLNSHLTTRWFFRAPFYLLGLGAIAILVLQYGFGWSLGSNGAMVAAQRGFLYGFVGFYLMVAAFITPKTILLRSGLAETFLCALLIWTTVEPLSRIPSSGVLLAAEVYAAFAVLYALSTLLLNPELIVSRWGSLRLSRPQLVVFSFLAVIGLGTLGLSLPKATVSPDGIGLIDTIFTATSAVCVTGLTVINVAQDLSTLGQGFMLALIQLGGLGLMTFTAFFSLILGRDLSLRGELVLRDTLDVQTVGRITSLVIGILTITIIAEGIGTILLFVSWPTDLPSTAQGIFWSLFHSVSAFSNAGFSLLPTNDFSIYRGAFVVNYTMMALIVVGGVGFFVIQNLLQVSPWGGGTDLKRPRLTLHTKLVLTITAVLILIGATLFFTLERNASMAGYTIGEQITASLFQAVTSRTAGFSTVPIGQLTYSAAFLLMILMFIGASPGSTGGGVKTSTIGILLGTIRSILKGRTETEIFKRTIPQDQVNRALAVIFIAFGVISASVFALMIVEGRPFIDVLFETISAFGTVGLSRGMTSELSSAGKVILIFTMLAGRIGPLTLALAIAERGVRGEYEYPQEYVMLG